MINDPSLADDSRSLATLIQCARGERSCDLVLSNCRVVNLFSREILDTQVGIVNGRIAGLGQYQGRRTVDLKGGFVCPGFIDGHIHLESSLVSPSQFARAAVAHGTTAVICDPHEITNVLGKAGLRSMLELDPDLPLDIFPMIPSCVPATDMETSGARLSAKDMGPLLDLDGIPGLAEMMNFPGTLAGDPEIMGRVLAARQRGLVVDGHAPGLTGPDLQAYCAAGIDSDHECTTLEEAREKLRAGMFVMIREGSTARNLETLLPLVRPDTADRFLLVSDDLHPHDLLKHGHLDRILRKVVGLGLDPISALRMVTLNPALRFGLRGRGGVAPGFRADLVVLDDLHRFAVARVFKDGKQVVSHGVVEEESSSASQRDTAVHLTGTMHIDWKQVDFRIPARSGLIRVIDCEDGQIVTGQSLLPPRIENGFAQADPQRDLLKIAVIERHRASGRMGLGFVRGFGMRDGALASTVAHDSHNLIVTGTDDELMNRAARAVAEAGGGLGLVTPHTSLVLPLPIGGLMSTKPLPEVIARLDNLLHLAKTTGIKTTNPFMLLSFLALPVIPSLKITDQGLINTESFQPVDLWVDNSEEKSR